MEISENEKLTLFYEVVDHLLGVVNSWMKDLRGRLPSTIQITTCQGASIVTVDDSVWVQHRDNFEDEVLSKNLGFWYFSTREVVNSTLHHPRAHRFSRMDTRCEYYTFASGHVLWVLLACNS